MTTLATTQRQFMNWLLQQQDDLVTLIEKSGKLDRRAKMDIYAEAYRLRLLEALQDSYPALHTLLGDARFAAIANDYISAHPSEHFSIRYFGHRLASFLSRCNHCPQPGLLTEMASFEWALRDAFDAADSSTLDVSALHQLAADHWPTQQFLFHPSTRWVDLEWNVATLWQAIEDDAEPVTAQKNDFAIRWLI
jgi:hypothetical protein